MPRAKAKPRVTATTSPPKLSSTRSSRTQRKKPEVNSKKVPNETKLTPPTHTATSRLEDIITISDDDEGTLENIPKTKVKKPEVKKKVTSKSKPAPTTTKNSAPNFFQMTSDDWMAVSDEDDDDDRVGVGAFDRMFENLQAKLCQMAAPNLPNKSKSGKTKTSKKTVKETMLALPSTSDEDELKIKSKPTSKQANVATLNTSREKFCMDVDNVLSGFETPPARRSLTKKNGRGRGKLSKSRSGKSPSPTQVDTDDEEDVQVLEEVSSSSSYWNLSSNSPQCITPIIAPPPPFTVRIRWRQEMFKFKLSETDYCFEIRRLLAQELQLNPAELSIYFEDDFDLETLDDTKTLKDANVGLGTVLEAHRKVSVPDSTSGPSVKQFKDPSLIRIKVQGVERRSELYFEIRKTDPLRQLQFLYCQKLGLAPNQVKFNFDGETVDLDETPVGLDLEGDECFDVIVS